MGIEEVKSLQTTVKNILDSTKEIANTKPETRITQASADTFNSILSQARSIEGLKDNPVIGKMKPMIIPSSLQDVALRGPKVVDLVTNLAAIEGVSLGFIAEHRKPMQQGGIENL
jgi:hypothetical protein